METIVKERPILFSGAMVRALLAGTKTQTRRAVKHLEYDDDMLGGVYMFAPPKGMGSDTSFAYCKNPASSTLLLATCPYGQVGERLFVRETLYWDACGEEWCYQANNEPVLIDEYTGILAKQKPAIPSIHMPRAASRLLLEIVAVRVERLQDISEADAKAEGAQLGLAPTIKLGGEPCTRCGQLKQAHDGVAFCCRGVAGVYSPYTYKGGFASLWEQINGPESWAANPWVWVVEFKIIQPA